MTALARCACSPPGGTAIEDEQAVADRRERVAQLVRQHRQELVLAAVGVAQILDQSLALRCLRLARRDVAIRLQDAIDPVLAP